MNKFLTVLALMAIFATVATAQTPAVVIAEGQPTNSDGPQMVFETDVMDYGVIEQGSDPYRIFTFTNTGNAPLVISNAKGSCGCTVPTYPKEPISPGASAEIKVRYDTNRIGKFTKRVTLTTNAGDESKILTIKGEVTKKPEEPAGVPAVEENPFNNNNN